MSFTIAQAIGQKLMWSFGGLKPTPAILRAIKQGQAGGITLFRAINAADVEQVRALNAALQAQAKKHGQPILLIGADQEGGTLVSVPGTTCFPGNLALGATRSPELARRVGYAIGQEMAALGFNVDYAPVCDVAISPDNPVIGPRSFGGYPQVVAQLSAAMVMGLQAAGMAAAPKHFPGHGNTSEDSHYGVPVSSHTLAQLDDIDLPAFKAVIQAKALLMMTTHIALPAVDGDNHLPATLSAGVLRGLLRHTLKFDGVIISDAMDMRAIQQGKYLLLELIAATRAGVDVLLMTKLLDQVGAYHGLIHAVDREILSRRDAFASLRRILRLKEWCAAQTQPGLEVVNCAAHNALALEVAQKSITLAKNTGGMAALRLPAAARVGVLVPRPVDLTPADTSSYETPALAAELRRYREQVDEIVYPINPDAGEVAALRQKMSEYDLILLATINARQHEGQVALARSLIQQNKNVIVIALRMPYDLDILPEMQTYICAYSLQQPSMKALAQALHGEIPFAGQLPVALPNHSKQE